MFSSKCVTLPLAIVLLSPLLIYAQAGKRPTDSATSSTYAYRDSEEGLERLLREVLAAARSGNRSKLASLVSQMEIPDYESWFPKTFGNEAGGSWAGSYGRDRGDREKDFEELFKQFAIADGEISTRKVNDRPDRTRPIETNLMEVLQSPVDIFFAGWKDRDSSPDDPEETIGYFMYVDGKFRWGSSITLLKIKYPDPEGPDATPIQTVPPEQAVKDSDNPSASNGPFRPGVGGVEYPSCDYCPGPSYPRQARAEGAEGTVVLKVIIQPDGHATDIQVITSPRKDFAEQAVEAVTNWRFKPAIGLNGEPVAVVAPIEVTFGLAH